MKKDFAKAIQTLEFDKIRSMLADCAETQGAKERAMRLEPDVIPERIKEEQAKTSEAKELIGVKGSPSFFGVYDISGSLDKAEKGGCMTPGELLKVSSLLHCAASLKTYLGEKREDFAHVAEYFDRLEGNKPLERAIGNAIVSEEMISDDASPELSAIRRKIKVINNRIKDNLQKYISDSSYTKYLQENIVTTRNGRYVIPVRAECKGEIKGLLHDVSSSGATMFIEPVAIVEANNDLHLLSIEEDREIEKILYALTEMCSKVSEELVLNYYNITEIAFVFAKGELSYRMSGTEPVINTDRSLELIKARHPLLDPKTVVPISVSLGKDFDALVITGPNTGGKTVTLKTLGIFALMVQAGLHIPAREGSSLCIFTSVYADIGDAQSIEMSLSTFSAHMKNIVSIMDGVDDNSLCLFDELGAGTDPTEGAALAISILTSVKNAGALCAATTHYSELKVYALDSDRVCNGSCEFDVTTLKPTYRLIIGTPGKSNAFAISERLGLRSDIVEDARNRVSGGERKFEHVIEQLEAERVMMERNREEAEKIKRDYEVKYRDSEKKIADKLRESEKATEKARREAENTLSSAKASARYILNELNELKRHKDDKSFAASLEETRRRVRNEFDKIDNEINPVIEQKEEEYHLPRELRKGDEVLIAALGKKGFLETDPDKSGNVTVSCGIFTSKCNIKDLRLIEEEITVTDKAGKKKKISEYTPEPIRAFSPEIDIRGENGEDGWLRVDKYLDEAIIMKVSSVRIVHGKGTGALRAFIQASLKKDKRVRSYRLGDYGEGDSGVTVVELK